MCTLRMKLQGVDSIFEALRVSGKQAVLFESGCGTGEWSFIGIVNPHVKVPAGEAGLKFMRKFLREHGRPRKAGDPPFTAGFAGFLSYDLGVKWQGVSQRVKQDTICPDAYFVYVDEVIAVRAGRGKAEGEAAGVAGRQNAVSCEECTDMPAPKSNVNYSEYSQKIAKVKKYLYSGDTYQVNFSQRFEASYSGDAFELYEKATRINPSPFQFFLETPEFAVISNSPERLFRIRGTLRQAQGDKFKAHSLRSCVIETRPIKGTVPRGRTPKEDARNIKRLLSSEKERAELAMIVDLERNDLGKICVPGTVEVNEDRVVEKYSHVIHTMSNIRGRLVPKYDWLDVLHALFPGGSITGCPKKRTVEIIDELEDYKRGVYCGSAGWIDLSGECDFNIMIRTIWHEKPSESELSSARRTLGKRSRRVCPGMPPCLKIGKPRCGRLLFHSGGGIVVDSMPENEYEETMHKAQALMNVLRNASVRTDVICNITRDT